jgi:hypothetical protein
MKMTTKNGGKAPAGEHQLGCGESCSERSLRVATSENKERPEWRVAISCAK